MRHVPYIVHGNKFDVTCQTPNVAPTPAANGIQHGFGLPVFTRLHDLRTLFDRLVKFQRRSKCIPPFSLACRHERGFYASLLSEMHVVIALRGKFPITSQPFWDSRLCIDAGKHWERSFDRKPVQAL
jgi:hypothetical protein